MIRVVNSENTNYVMATCLKPREKNKWVMVSVSE